MMMLQSISSELLCLEVIDNICNHLFHIVFLWAIVFIISNIKALERDVILTTEVGAFQNHIKAE